MKTCITNGKIIVPGGVIQDGSVICDGGTISDIIQGQVSPEDGEVIDAGGRWVSPGFVDIHVHGGGGSDFMDGTPEAFATIASTHARYGTTSLAATTTTSSDGELLNVLDVFKEARRASCNGAEILGLHLEGPFLNAAYCGAQDNRYLRNPDPKLYKEVLSKASGDIIRWSVAPELEGSMELGRILKDNGITGSIAHSAATWQEVSEAWQNGYSLLTHFYCAMSTIVRRNAWRFLGAIESGYLIDDMDVEIIADGCHLPAELLQFICKFKSHKHIALCTDAMRAAGMPEGEYNLGSEDGGQRVIVEDGVAKLMDRSAFAGSVSTTDRLVRTMVRLAGLSLPEAVEMMTINPARMVHADGRKGSIEKGKDADIVIFDNDINIYGTITKGKLIYGID